MPRALLAKSLLETCAIQNVFKGIEETFLLSGKTKFCFPNDVSKWNKQHFSAKAVKYCDE